MKKHAHIKEKALKEIDSVLEGKKDYLKEFTLDDTENLSYVKQCYMETMRLDSPVVASTTLTFTEDTVFGGVLIDAGEMMQFNYNGPHHDKTQWKEPMKFVPERFDPKNKEWSLTPDGKKRAPYSFVAFHGGQRVCLGKTFAEQAMKFTLPLILKEYELIPEEKLHEYKSFLSITMPFTSEYFFTVKKRTT